MVKTFKRETMKYTNILLTTSAVAFLATGCVKPVQGNNQAVYGTDQQSVYQEAPIVYEDPTPSTSQSGVIYNQIPEDNTVISSGSTYPETITYPSDPNQQVYTNPSITNQPVYEGSSSESTQSVYGTSTTQNSQPVYDSSINQNSQPVYDNAAQPTQQVYTNPYESAGTTNYPDPYANGSVSPAVTNYPTQNTTYTAPASSSAQGAGGIHLQVAAFKKLYAAEELKNTLTLAPGQSAYIQQGAMNKVIITGISSVAEANQLKNTRFPGAFIVKGGGNSGSYTSAPEPTYNSTGTTYTVNNPYGVPTPANNTYSNETYSSSANNGIGVQVGAFSSRSKAQDIANSQGGQYPAMVKKIGKYYKVILTGFSNRSAAKSYARRVGGFVVSTH